MGPLFPFGFSSCNLRFFFSPRLRQNVVVFTHIPLHPSVNSPGEDCLLWNYEEVTDKELLPQFPRPFKEPIHPAPISFPGPFCPLPLCQKCARSRLRPYSLPPVYLRRAPNPPLCFWCNLGVYRDRRCLYYSTCVRRQDRVCRKR